MIQLDETSNRLLELLQAYARWQRPSDDRTLTEDERRLVRSLAEDRLTAGSETRDLAIQLVARSREARAMWTTIVEMEYGIETSVLESMQQSLATFVESKSSKAPDSATAVDSTTATVPSSGRATASASEHSGDAGYSAQVVDLVSRLRRASPRPPQPGFAVERFAAETYFASAGRGKFVTEDMVMSLVFPSMDPSAAPIGFLITCPPEIVRKRYTGKRFRVLFVEPESRESGKLDHRVMEVGPFDSSGEIESRFGMESALDACVVPVWIDVLGDLEAERDV